MKEIFTWLYDIFTRDYEVKLKYGLVHYNFGTKVKNTLLGLKDPSVKVYKDLREEINWNFDPEPTSSDFYNKTFEWATVPMDGVIKLFIPITYNTIFSIEKLVFVSTKLPSEVYFQDIPAIRDAGGIIYRPHDPAQMPDYIQVIFDVTDDPEPITFTITEAMLVIKEFGV